MSSKQEAKRLITIHLPEADCGIKIHTRTQAQNLLPTVNAPGAELIAVFADEDRELRAFATGHADLVQAMIEDAYPFVCLIDLLEAYAVWVFTTPDACDSVRRSVRENLAQRSGVVELDVAHFEPGKSVPDLIEPGLLTADLCEQGLTEPDAAEPGGAGAGESEPGLSETGLPETGLSETGLPGSGLLGTGELEPAPQ